MKLTIGKTVSRFKSAASCRQGLYVTKDGEACVVVSDGKIMDEEWFGVVLTPVGVNILIGPAFDDLQLRLPLEGDEFDVKEIR